MRARRWMKNHRVALSSFRPLLSNDFSERTTIMLSNNAVVVYFSRTGENYSVGEIEVGSTAKVAQNDADATAQAVENWIG